MKPYFIISLLLEKKTYCESFRHYPIYKTISKQQNKFLVLKFTPNSNFETHETCGLSVLDANFLLHLRNFMSVLKFVSVKLVWTYIYLNSHIHIILLQHKLICFFCSSCGILIFFFRLINPSSIKLARLFSCKHLLLL